MALGAKLGPLLTTNAVVTIEEPTVVITGGTTITWSEVVCEVDVLITQLDGDRAPQAGGDFQNDTHTVRGLAVTYPELARTDIRLKVDECPDLPDLEGLYLRVNSSVGHPAGRGRRVNAFVVIRASRIQVGANQL